MMTYDEMFALKGVAHRKHPRHIESQLQQSAVAWFRLQYPNLMIAAIPNGGFRNTREASIMKKEGTLAGFSDLIVVGKGRVLFVEMKTPQGRLSESQKRFKERVNSLGHEYVVCRSLEQFVCAVSRWEKEVISKRNHV